MWANFLYFLAVICWVYIGWSVWSYAGDYEFDPEERCASFWAVVCLIFYYNY